MSRTVEALYDNVETAKEVARELEDQGFVPAQILVTAQKIKSEQGVENLVVDYRERNLRIPAGAGIGAMIGGLGGMLVSSASSTFPSIEMLVQVGPIISTLFVAGVGASLGGVAGAFISRNESKLALDSATPVMVDEGNSGDAKVYLRAQEGAVKRALTIMSQYQPIYIDHKNAKKQQLL